MYMCSVMFFVCLEKKKDTVLTNEVVNFQSVIKKGLKLVVLVQWHARMRFYAP